MGNGHNRASIGTTECKGTIWRGPLGKPVLFPKRYLLRTVKIAGLVYKT